MISISIPFLFFLLNRILNGEKVRFKKSFYQKKRGRTAAKLATPSERKREREKEKEGEMLPKDWKKKERTNSSNQLVFYYVSPDGREFNSLFEVQEEVKRMKQITPPPPPLPPPPSNLFSSSSFSSSTSLLGDDEDDDPNNDDGDPWFGLKGKQNENVLTAEEWLEGRREKKEKYDKKGIKSLTEFNKKKTCREEVLNRFARGVPVKGMDKAGKDVLDQFFTMQGWYKHDGIPTSYTEILCEIECNRDIFHEVDSDSPCFGAILSYYFLGKPYVRAKTNVQIDRIYRIGPEGDGIPKKSESFGFYSSPNFKTLVSCARKALPPRDPVIFHPACHEALGKLRGFHYCLILGYSADDVYEGDVPPRKVAKVTYGYSAKHNKAAFCASQGSMRPLLLVLFRKVRKSDLWVTTRNNEVLAAPAPIPVIPYPTTDDSTVASTRMFFEKLQQKSTDFCNNRNVVMYMIPKTICVTEKFICLSSRAPREKLDLIVASRSPLNWDTLSQKDKGEIIGLYTFAHYVRSVIRDLNVCMLNMEVLFPIDPAQWLVHCHVMACDAHSETRKQFLSIDEFLERLNNGEVGRDSGYKVRAEYDLGSSVPAPNPDTTKTPDEQKADLWDYLLTQNNGFYPQYWYGGSGDEPIVKNPLKTMK